MDEWIVSSRGERQVTLPNRFVLIATLGKQQYIFGPIVGERQAQADVASFKILNPEYRGWKIVPLYGVRDIKRNSSLLLLKTQVLSGERTG
jgi:hypothetical protein